MTTTKKAVTVTFAEVAKKEKQFTLGAVAIEAIETGMLDLPASVPLTPSEAKYVNITGGNQLGKLCRAVLDLEGQEFTLSELGGYTDGMYDLGIKGVKQTPTTVATFYSYALKRLGLIQAA